MKRSDLLLSTIIFVLFSSTSFAANQYGKVVEEATHQTTETVTTATPNQESTTQAPQVVTEEHVTTDTYRKKAIAGHDLSPDDKQKIRQDQKKSITNKRFSRNSTV